MDNTEYIDDYFNGSPTDDQKQQFEQRIVNDISFAEEVAFYISANGLLHEQLKGEKKKRFREIYEEQKVVPLIKQPLKKMWGYMAAASVVAAVVLLTWLFSGKNASSEQLAVQYIQQNFQTAGVSMGDKEDSLQAGFNLFNSKKLPEALVKFENVLKNDPENDVAKKYAGITSLRLEQYDKALAYFSSLASDTLFSNPGKFFESVTLLKRNKPGDIAAAKKLLQDVGEKGLEGKEEALEWLPELK